MSQEYVTIYYICRHCGEESALSVPRAERINPANDNQFYLTCGRCNNRFLRSNFELPDGPFLNAWKDARRNHTYVACPAKRCGALHKNLSNYKRCIAKHLKPYICVKCERAHSHRVHHFTRVDDCITHIQSQHYKDVLIPRRDFEEGSDYRVMSNYELEGEAQVFFANGG